MGGSATQAGYLGGREREGALFARSLSGGQAPRLAKNAFPVQAVWLLPLRRRFRLQGGLDATLARRSH